MNTKTLLTIKTDKKLKDDAKKVADELGIPLGTFINATLKQFVRQKEISLSVSYEPTNYLAKILKTAHSEYRRGETSKPVVSVSELMKSLNS